MAALTGFQPVVKTTMKRLTARQKTWAIIGIAVFIGCLLMSAVGLWVALHEAGIGCPAGVC
jgi:hypothetical protein